jgi:hypothetical protein
MSKTVIIINGLPRSGKDTVVELTTKHLERLEWTAAAFSSIDPVRTLLKRMGFLIDRKTEADRKLLSAVGDAVEEYNSFKTHQAVRYVEESNADFVFIHMREPAMITKLTKALLMRVRDVKVATLFVWNRGEPITSNSADANVHNYTYDLRINNGHGLKELDKQCEALALNLTCSYRPAQAA